jgi:signal transduction histidine kinase
MQDRVAALPQRWLILSVHDNGRGISASQVHDPGSVGLAGMRERAMTLGGSVRVEAMPGSGTRVTVYIPHPYGERL